MTCTAAWCAKAACKSQSLSYYGMQLAHLGIAVFIIGVTLVKGYETERDVRMAPGDTVTAAVTPSVSTA